MTKSATDIMQEILFSAVLDSVVALKEASKGVPNALLRDLSSVHANTTLADLPGPVQAAIATNVRSAFTRLLKEGYAVAPSTSVPPPVRQVPAGARPPRPGGSGRPPTVETKRRPPQRPTDGRPPRGKR